MAIKISPCRRATSHSAVCDSSSDAPRRSTERMSERVMRGVTSGTCLKNQICRGPVRVAERKMRFVSVDVVHCVTQRVWVKSHASAARMDALLRPDVASMLLFCPGPVRVAARSLRHGAREHSLQHSRCQTAPCPAPSAFMELRRTGRRAGIDHSVIGAAASLCHHHEFRNIQGRIPVFHVKHVNSAFVFTPFDGVWMWLWRTPCSARSSTAANARRLPGSSRPPSRRS